VSRQRVAITGIGAITPIGNGAAGLWRGVLAGQSAVRRVTRFDPTPFRSHLAAEVVEFDPTQCIEPRRARRLDRFAQMAVAAALQAVRDAGLPLDDRARQAMGCYLGSALGGVAFGEEQHHVFLRHGAGAVSPWLALAVFGGAATTNIAIDLGLRGPTLANSNSCAAGAIAIGEAFRLVRGGAAPGMLAGGVEAPLAPLTFGAFALIRAMSTANDTPERASRPFDAERDGFVMGEGAAVLVLEHLASARARGARVYAEVCGYGATTDAYHMTAPLPDGSEAARAMRIALEDAGVSPSAVDYVNAHATGTPLGDRAEALAILRALGDHGARVPVSSTKGLYGHPLGASGAIEAAICALAIHHGFVPGTTNLRAPDPECSLALVGPEGLPQRPRLVLSNAFGFGGINACLVLAAVE
jgi:3-oxoacyl-[acyl-carrier-protein] synthase II